MQKMIIGFFALMFGLRVCQANAQILESTPPDSQGKETRFMIFQAGKDTTVFGVPFNVADKLGMTIEIYKRPKESQNKFFLALRTDNPKITNSSNLENTQLLFVMLNKDSVRIPLTKVFT